MKLLKWFYPGMKIKRWIALTIFGGIMISMGFVIIISEERGKASVGTSILILIGIIIVITGVKRIINSLITIIMPQGDKDLVDIVYKKRQLDRGPKVVAIGSGSGLSMVLHGLKEYTTNITAVVTPVDEGRVSGGAYDQISVSLPKSVRECLIALSDAGPVAGRLFEYRFKKGTELWGYNFGDLFLTAMSDITGDPDKAVKESSRVLAIRGQVVLSTLTKVSLIARHQDQTETIGIEDILNSMSPIKRVHIRPQSAKPTAEFMNAIARAEAVVICPGALYTKIMPTLLLDGVSGALVNSKAVKICVMNLMTNASETEGYKASDHLTAIHDHAAAKIIDYCIVNTADIQKESLKGYEQEGAAVVPPDKAMLESQGCKVLEGPFIDRNSALIRHDSLRLAGAISDLINEFRRTKVHVK